MKHRRNEHGLTLVELLVVLGIVSVMAAIAIPTFIRYNTLSSGDLFDTAQEIQQMLRAAKVYAGTNNIDAAVVYSVAEVEDSVSGNTVTVIDGMALVRRMTEDEQTALAEALAEAGIVLPSQTCSSPSLDFPTFTPVRDARGSFQRFTGETAVAFMKKTAPQVEYAGEMFDPFFVADITDFSTPDDSSIRELGFVPINVASIEGPGEDRMAQSPPGTEFPSGCSGFGFPAHVFTTTGEMQTQSEKQRFELPVTGMPNLVEQDRFVVVQPPGGLPIRRTLELFATLGRVKITT